MKYLLITASSRGDLHFEGCEWIVRTVLKGNVNGFSAIYCSSVDPNSNEYLPIECMLELNVK